MKRTVSPLVLAALILATILTSTLLVVATFELVVELFGDLPGAWQRHFVRE